MAGFEPALGFIDHVEAAFTAHNAIVAVPLGQRLERITDFHDVTCVKPATGLHNLELTAENRGALI